MTTRKESTCEWCDKPVSKIYKVNGLGDSKFCEQCASDLDRAAARSRKI